ncbi:MAG: flagellar basal body rod protein FlgB [Bacillaceae bacterium]|mgnify:FL=1|jgi:flagellar basal-body rod protein FlgB|uniref:Flagellar basal body rod protein FlgB n=2 Tax=Aeribacillus TaxID=1055323 RepID=A0A165YYF5_9BACI|nr:MULTISPECIES: flagellar basal body rod protein FlgB [Aeribacillus]AXI39847.1 flagellar basal body rod protein FlgB [Bacillaceae bacterium ZC4]REJ16735.1 MAG: flagellar basal body rod protein FlgB [Bacillaceae bacterium]ASS91565.1 flagellar basal body rod protein FlgB [Aeribacillus pallidus]KZM57983.1 flagellar biosynthesis protein FlgB [Aeribacillus pallidus]KZN97592.1 flagellar biosynthesis protein FlgB [Aeribacillus pallidus]
MKIFSNSIANLEQAIRISSLNGKVIANNIANVDTPGYKAKTVNFKNVLDQQIKLDAYRTNPRHLPFVGSESTSIVETRTNSAYQHNGNNVDIDQEMAKLAENQIFYNALIDRLNGKFNSLKTVIKGGRT